MDELLMSNIPFTFYQPTESARSALVPSSSPGNTPIRPRLSGLPPYPSFLTDPLNSWNDHPTDYYALACQEAIEQVSPSIDPSLVRWQSPSSRSDPSLPIHYAAARLQSVIQSPSRISTPIGSDVTASDSELETDGDDDAEGETCSEYDAGATRTPSLSPVAAEISTVSECVIPSTIPNSLPLPQHSPSTPKAPSTRPLPIAKQTSPLSKQITPPPAKKLPTPISAYAKSIAESRPRRRPAFIAPPPPTPSLSPSPPPTRIAKRRRHVPSYTSTPEPTIDTPSPLAVESDSALEVESSEDEDIKPSKRRRAAGGTGRNMMKRGPQNVKAQKKYRDKKGNMYDSSVDCNVDMIILADRLGQSKAAQKLRARLARWQEELREVDTVKGLQYTKFQARLKERRAELQN